MVEPMTLVDAGFMRGHQQLKRCLSFIVSPKRLVKAIDALLAAAEQHYHAQHAQLTSLEVMQLSHSLQLVSQLIYCHRNQTALAELHALRLNLPLPLRLPLGAFLKEIVM